MHTLKPDSTLSIFLGSPGDLKYFSGSPGDLKYVEVTAYHKQTQETKQFDDLKPTPSDDVEYFLKRAEHKIRSKVEKVIKRKLDTKLTEKAIEEEHIEILEHALREDMEDIVKEKLNELRNTFETVDEEHDEESHSDCYGPPEGCSGFYWGSNEIIFYD